MTQAPFRPAPSLKLVSLQLPETVDWMGKPLQQTADENVLLLVPGQHSDISIQVQNTGNSPLQWRLELKGNFPDQWWEEQNQSAWSNIYEIEPQQKFQGVVRLNIPPEFFEAQAALAARSQLDLNYQSEIFLYVVEGNDLEQKQLVDYRAVELWVRPDCFYLNYLPEIYQATDFMGRFLMIFEQAFDPTLDTMDAFWAYLDPITAPKALLPFLSQWVAWDLNPRWTLKQQRRLLRNAIRLYRWRGTRWGLLVYLHLYTGLPLEETEIPEDLRVNLNLQEVEVSESQKRISVVEDYNSGFVLGQVKLSDSPMLGGGKPYHFRVNLRPDSIEQIDQHLVRNIIEQVKPSFCTYDLRIVDF